MAIVNRKARNRLATTLLAIGTLGFFAQAAWPDGIGISTPEGRLLGEASGSDDVVSFKGIPYARPPVGDLRWKPPVPVSAWQGAREATTFGPACIQKTSASTAFYQNNLPNQSEDCLTLNVWARKTAHKAPVIVWIHGGNLLQGSGSEYNGAAFARRGVVLVTINYRLDVLGYFSHPELSAESKNHASGNYGTLDQIEALSWVKRNIAAFGGDSKNVTIMGESAGALSVTHLMASPLAKNLFQKAIAESAYLPPIPALREPRFGLTAAEQTGVEFGAAADASSLAALRRLDAKSLLGVSLRTHFITQAVVDGWVQPRQIFETFEQGLEVPAPLILGYNSDEARSFAGYGIALLVPPDSATYENMIRARYGDLSDRYLALYPASNVKDSVYDVIRDGFYGWAAERFAREHTTRAPTWLYRFDHASATAAERGLGAYHASEVQFVFGDVGQPTATRLNFLGTPNRPVDIEMSKVVMDYWVDFARSGKPQPAGQPKWPAFNPDTVSQMIFRDGKAQPATRVEPGMFELHEEIVARRRRAGNIPWVFTNVGIAAPELSH
jgi:para-nitrobenzyl esterase